MPMLRRRARLLLGCAIVVSVAALGGMALGAYNDTWDGVVLVLAAILWIAHLNASVHATVKAEIRRRMDTLQADLADQQERNTREIVREITTSEARDRFIREISRELAERERGDAS